MVTLVIPTIISLWQIPANDADFKKHHDHGCGVFNQQIWGGPAKEGRDAQREAAQSVG